MKTRGYLIRISCRSYTATTVMVFFSIVVAVFCMTVIAGYAETYYRSWSSANIYTTITIAGIDEETKSIDMLSELKKDGLSTAIYICRSNDGAVMVGFDGADEASNWWPEMAGDFVNNYSGEDYPYIVYLTDFEAENVPIGDLLKIDDTNYRMIGYGWITPETFTRTISRSSPQTVFEITGGATYSNGELEDITRAFRVVPYQAFRESYKPDLILLHFPKLNYGQMLKMTDRIGKMFPHSTVTPPTANASEAFQRALQIMRHFIPLFLILTEITVVMAVCELYKKLRTECYVCRICGMPQGQVRWRLIGEVGLLYLVGTCFALLLQITLKGFLTSLDAGEMPTIIESTVAAIVLYVITVVFSLPALNKVLRLQRMEDE